ncbi:hypothetical protein E2C01_060362 [Portunus trituberculatus]|uniref:Uncharacterized protein n=1 Tax=Portunus trituberculatus TaxID=210409 RepID=A0A5B7H8I1_PORTR|nr:hypothetical protein [Portunus trituberculatus]
MIQAEFDKVDDDVQDLLEIHAEPPSNDELIEQDKASQETEKEGDEEEPVLGLDIKTLRECLGGIEKALEASADPASTGPSSISSFFKPVKRADPATAGPSTSLPTVQTTMSYPCLSTQWKMSKG